MIDSIQVTQEEIEKFRTELVNYPKPEALLSLDVIEECEGYLDDAVPLLLMRETGAETERATIGELFEKCRGFICQEEVREALECGVLAPAIEPISIGAGIPPGTATAVAICAFKLGMKKLCGNTKS